ncbi:MAG TPA: type I polyketide synthase, partial [Polyangiaceae bacterium]|nr:type I polyketide synthase [Polyangiaceae bacterium]
MPLSAKGPEALAALAGRYAEWLRGPGASMPLEAIARTASRGRSHHPHRLALVASSHEQLAAQLAAFAAGEVPPGASTGVVPAGARAKVAFVFPGQGSQWLGMGRSLLAEPAFARALEALEAPIQRHGGFSVRDELLASPERSRLDEVQVVQPVLFTVSVALARLWQAWGLEPAALVGHSMGEVAAACVAGVLTDEDAARVICARSRLVRRASGRGGMLAVELGEAEAQRALAPYGGALAVAAVNGPAAVVVAGDVGPLEALARELEGRGVFARRVKVDYASHCGHMDALRAPLLEALGGLRPRAGVVPLASTVTGEVTDGAGLDGAYWADNLRQPVRLDRAVGRVVEEGVRLFVEVSPHPVLVPSLEALAGGQAAVVGSTRREQPERARMLESLGALYTRGASIDWQRLHEGRGLLAELPTYAFQRERFWLTPPARTAAKRGGHPLVGEGRELSTEAGGWLFEAEVDGAGTYGEHRVQGAALLPATAFVEMALEAGARALGGPCEVHRLELQQPLVLGETPRQVQTMVRGDGALVVSSRGENEPGWTAHARAHLRRAEAEALPEPLPTESEAAQGERRLDVEGFYGTLAARGLEYGPAFRGLSDLYAGEGRARARLRRSERVGREQRQYGWHPALLDAALQATGACVPDQRTWVPAGLGRVRAAPGGDARASQMRAHVTPAGPDRYEGTVQVLDEGGRVLLAIEGLALAPLRESE